LGSEALECAQLAAAFLVRKLACEQLDLQRDASVFAPDFPALTQTGKRLGWRKAAASCAHSKASLWEFACTLRTAMRVLAGILALPSLPRGTKIIQSRRSLTRICGRMARIHSHK